MLISRRGFLAASAAGLLLTACGEDDSAPAAEKPRPLSAAEAELLALCRFRLHQRDVVPVEMAWPGDPSMTVRGALGLRDGRGHGVLSTPGAEERLIVWDLVRVGTAPAADSVPALDAWATRALSTGVPQDIFLLLALSLGADRPENPVLLQQSSARFLREDEVAGVPVVVLEGPRPADEAERKSSRSRYWIAEDGTVRRFEAYLGDAGGRFAALTVIAEDPSPEGLAQVVPQVLRTS
ncbi:hypothetical protein [Nocardioides daejeonensis]|uniref:hypothetical protein n=1 Tax=Nocardioides daejeonensis TaxID=1046556 RepID=UPI000D75057E|nr:hypothetical protein [Nocardioides daejeonensis]